MKRREFLRRQPCWPRLLRPGTDRGGRTRTNPGSSVLFDGTSLNGWSVADGAESAFYVNDGAIVAHESAGFPTWLRSARQYENFDFRGEFFVRGG